MSLNGQNIKAYQIDFKWFLELVLIKIPYGVTEGVFVKEENVQFLDVYLPDQNAEFGRAWQGTIHVRYGSLISALRNLHRGLVLAQRQKYRKAVSEGHAHLYEEPADYLVHHYRSAELADLKVGIERALSEGKAKPMYGNSALAYPVYEFSPVGWDVSISLVVKTKQLVLTDQDRRAHPSIDLESLDQDVILETVIKFLAEQNIRVVDTPPESA